VGDGCISKTIPVKLEPGAILSGSDHYNLYNKLYNLINYLSPAHLKTGIVTLKHSAVGIQIHMIIYKPYAIDLI